MDAELVNYKRCVLVKVKGRIDSSNAQEFQSVMESLTNDGQLKIVLDLSEVNFMSSRGWWVLVQTQKVCKRYNRGELVLAEVQENIRSSLDLVGMGSYFKLYDDVLSAVGSF